MSNQTLQFAETPKCYKCDREATQKYVTATGNMLPVCEEHEKLFPNKKRFLPLDADASNLPTISSPKPRVIIEKVREEIRMADALVEGAKTEAEAARSLANTMRLKAPRQSSLKCPKCGNIHVNYLVLNRKKARKKGKKKVPWCFKCNIEMKPTSQKHIYVLKHKHHRDFTFVRR